MDRKNQTEKLCTPPSNDDDDWTLGKAIECPFRCGSDPHYTTLPGTKGRNRVTTILIITYKHAPKAFGLPCLVSDFRRALRLPIGAVSYKGVVYLCVRRRIHLDVHPSRCLPIFGHCPCPQSGLMKTVWKFSSCPAASQRVRANKKKMVQMVKHCPPLWYYWLPVFS